MSALSSLVSGLVSVCLVVVVGGEGGESESARSGPTWLQSGGERESRGRSSL